MVALLTWPATRPAQARLAALRAPAPKRGWRLPAWLRPPRLWLTALPVAIPFLGLAGTLSVGALCAAGWQQRRVRRRRKAETERATAVAEALRVMVAELRGGASPTAAREAALAVAPGQVSSLLAGFDEEGPEFVAGIRGRLATAAALSRRHGLPLADLLDAVRRDLVAGARFLSRSEAGMAGPRASATVLAALPGIGLLLGEAMGAHPVYLLVTTPPGQLLMALGSALILAGVAWSARLTAVRVLP
ncbi:hypothetical protein FNH05_29345 [Amycolatopsis rhizosphaerae]|uniref:Pilus assembly protein TadB n=1 Tax=Amycolatopsis rhizosphaerae TaxID=2053003 RepID=A0A558B178_9PSEU|nr:hypothetical protein FNH05_29345 [Amycolatopsis rhizosphaerae]